jgi:hypothetical protein
MRSLTHAAMLSALLWPAAAGAQVVRGRVVDHETTQPIRVAALELLDDRDKVLVRATADSTGAFRLRAWTAGKYRLRVASLGYESVTSELYELAGGSDLVLTIQLAPRAVPVQPITVVARSVTPLKEIALRGYYDRRDYGRRIGIGRFLDRAEIVQRGTKLTDVLRTVPGLRIIRDPSGCVFIATTSNPGGTNPSTPNVGDTTNCKRSMTVCPASVYLDGLNLTPDRVSIDQLVPLDWLEAIEVYRRAAEMPAEFLGSGACGVVAIWTRRG